MSKQDRATHTIFSSGSSPFRCRCCNTLQLLIVNCFCCTFICLSWSPHVIIIMIILRYYLNVIINLVLFPHSKKTTQNNNILYTEAYYTCTYIKYPLKLHYPAPWSSSQPTLHSRSCPPYQYQTTEYRLTPTSWGHHAGKKKTQNPENTNK